MGAGRAHTASNDTDTDIYATLHTYLWRFFDTIVVLRSFWFSYLISVCMSDGLSIAFYGLYLFSRVSTDMCTHASEMKRHTHSVRQKCNCISFQCVEDVTENCMRTILAVRFICRCSVNSSMWGEKLKPKKKKITTSRQSVASRSMKINRFFPLLFSSPCIGWSNICIAAVIRTALWSHLRLNGKFCSLFYQHATFTKTIYFFTASCIITSNMFMKWKTRKNGFFFVPIRCVFSAFLCDFWQFSVASSQ